MVEGEDQGEYLAEFFAKALVVEAYGREQVQAQGDADAGGDQDSADENLAPGVADVVADFLDVAQQKQGREIEAEVHDLGQGEEAAGEGAARDGDFEIGMQRD